MAILGQHLGRALGFNFGLKPLGGETGTGLGKVRPKLKGGQGQSQKLLFLRRKQLKFRGPGRGPPEKEKVW